MNESEPNQAPKKDVKLPPAIDEIHLVISSVEDGGGIHYHFKPSIRVDYINGAYHELYVQGVENLDRYDASVLNFETYLGKEQERVWEDFGERTSIEGLVSLETTEPDLTPTALLVNDLTWCLPKLGYFGGLIATDRDKAISTYVSELESNGVYQPRADNDQAEFSVQKRAETIENNLEREKSYGNN